MMYDYKLHLTIRTPRACPWEQSDKKYMKEEIKNKEEFVKTLKELEGEKMINKSIYVIAKIFDQQGCIAYRCKTINEARCLPGTLEALRAEGVQIVILDDPDIYSEYAPYEYVDDMKEFIDRVNILNKNFTA